VAHIFGGNESDRGQVTAFINALAGLVVGRPFSVGLLAHTARHVSSEFAGSAAWENAVRMRWYFGATLPDAKPLDADEQPSPDVRYLAKRKANYAAQDHVRMTYRNGVYVPDGAPTYLEGVLRSADERHVEDIVLAGFRSLKSIGIDASDAAQAHGYLPKQLIDKGLHDGRTKAELRAAMNRLMGRKTFTHGPIGRGKDRHAKEGLILNVKAEPCGK